MTFLRLGHNWLSAAIREDKKVREALSDLSRLIREYEDSAKPSACRGSSKGFFSAELDWFRPGWKLFVVISVAAGVSGALHSVLEPAFKADTWADLALGATIPVFVLGVSVVTLARSMSDSGRFAVDYLNESCRMAWFCCFTLFAVLLAFGGRILAATASCPTATGGLCGASLGAAVACLSMLAFVVRETIRCSLPTEAIKVVSQYAARRLCYGHMKETYIKLLASQRKDYLERWCTENCKAIHPPSKYYGYQFSLHDRQAGDTGVHEVRLQGRDHKSTAYKDFHLGRLIELDTFLKGKSLELYLSSPDYESEQAVLGVLGPPENACDQRVKAEVERLGRRTARICRSEHEEEGDDFWDSQESALNEAIERAVSRADPVQVRAFLDAVNTPLAVLRETRRHRVVRDAYGQHVRRGYDFLGLYRVALSQILAGQEREPKHQAQRVYLLRSIWEETRKILESLDYHTLELFTWLVLQLYRTITDAGDKAGPLLQMRAQFGGFYEFAEGWLERGESKDTEAVGRMRLVLHEGLTRWLLMVLERPEESELVKQLCDASRAIVFGRKGIVFDRTELVARHFVLAGYLMCRPEADGVIAGAIERLFSEEHVHDLEMSFDDLVGFYLANPSPPQMLDAYLHLFYHPQRTHADLLTGSSNSTGFGMTGVQEMLLAFIYLAASALADSIEEPVPVAKDLLPSVSDEAMKTVAELFRNPGVGCGLKRLKHWRDESKKLADATDARAVAEAELNPQKTAEWEEKFWTAYRASSPILSLLLKNGNYDLDEAALTEPHYSLPRIAVIEWEYPISGAGGDDYGRSLGQFLEAELIRRLTKRQGRVSCVKGEVAELVGEAATWLAKRGRTGENGLIAVTGGRSPERGLYADDRFVPSWKEDVRSKGFDGFYDDFPIVWLRPEQDGEQADQSREQIAIGVDLKAWKGIKARKSVIAQREFGKVTIRDWSEEESAKLLKSGEWKQEDLDRNCAVDISLYWQFSDNGLPPVRVFRACDAKEEEAESACQGQDKRHAANRPPKRKKTVRKTQRRTKSVQSKKSVKKPDKPKRSVKGPKGRTSPKAEKGGNQDRS